MTPYYEHAGITIYHGDCLDILPRMTEAAFGSYVTDPPYTAAGGSSNGRSSEYDGQFFRHWMRSVYQAMRRCTTPAACAFIFCDWRSLGDLVFAFREPGETQTAVSWKVRQALVWDRESIGLGAPFRNSFEMIAYASGGRCDPQIHMGKSEGTLLRCRWPYGVSEHHPSEKPLDLVRRLVAFASPNDYTVCDPFMGSGTTLLAAKLRQQRAVGIEQDERYCEIAARRLSQEVLPLEMAP